MPAKKTKTARGANRKRAPAKTTGRKTAQPKTSKRAPAAKKPTKAVRKGPKTPAKAARKATTKPRKVTKKAPTRAAKGGTTRRRGQATGPQFADPNSITVQPMLVAPDVDAEIAFLEQLGFQTVMKMPGPGGMTMHAVLMMNNGLIHIDPLDFPGMADMPGMNDEMRTRWEAVKKGPIGLGMSLYVMVPDVDKVFATATRLGARVFEAPNDKFWGDRSCAFYDPAGYLWSFATNVKTVSPEDMAKAMEQMAGAMAA